MVAWRDGGSRKGRSQMNTWKQTMMAAAVLAGLGVTAQAANEGAQKEGAQQQSSAQTDAASGAQQAGDKQKAGQQQGAMSPEKMFAKMAVIGNMKEVKLAEIAMQNASSEEVKKIAQHIQTDHKQANDKLMPIAQKLGVEVPKELPPDKQEIVTYFQSLQGEQFDKEYISAMKAGHAHDVSKYQDVAQMCKDPELKQYAQMVLPKLQQHQQHVMAAASQLGLPTGSGATAAGQGSDTAQPAGQRLDGSRSSGQAGDAGAAGTSSGGSSNSSTSGGAGGASGASGASGAAPSGNSQ